MALQFLQGMLFMLVGQFKREHSDARQVLWQMGDAGQHCWQEQRWYVMTL